MKTMTKVRGSSGRAVVAEAAVVAVVAVIDIFVPLNALGSTLRSPPRTLRGLAASRK